MSLDILVARQRLKTNDKNLYLLSICDNNLYPLPKLYKNIVKLNGIQGIKRAVRGAAPVVLGIVERKEHVPL